MYRPVRQDDLDSIAALEEELFAELAYSYMALRQLYDLHGKHWILAAAEDTVRGYALVGLGSEQCGWVMGLGVAENYQRRGVGRTLLERAVAHCRAAEARRVRLTVRPGHHTAGNLYKSVGFVSVSSEDRYFGIGEPREVLELDFDDTPRRWGGPEHEDPERWIKRPPGPRP
ncbi:GNAT family N-acetyltransferase [Nocardia takedensis]|uniref:GNAT family N-acetyltransferase n=1 Tax=Nocardia takedensis TaxID=259390 RepID=UPI00030F2EBD|nr:GNAT family N-acetyltransferase [Nocardia takedensis]